ncbi:hypothetical protein [Streptomyces sp. NPDC031705]|uniref:hypothetical protein n=1 Tax=unclassified Streptomyces TaxID=2593676 RepID=UPI00340ECA39
MLHSPTDLAHRRTRPLHWLATATALAAVIAGAGLLQPGRATGATPATGLPAGVPAAAPGGPPPAAPDAQAAAYPLDCKGAPHTVTATAQGDLDGDGRPETVAAVRCDAGSGTPPHALYVLARDPQGPAPRVVATLLDTALRRTATELTVRDGLVTARLLGYSSPSVPRFSPDVEQLAKWRWTGGKFRQELTDSAAGSV